MAQQRIGLTDESLTEDARQCPSADPDSAKNVQGAYNHKQPRCLSLPKIEDGHCAHDKQGQKNQSYNINFSHKTTRAAGVQAASVNRQNRDIVVQRVELVEPQTSRGFVIKSDVNLKHRWFVRVLSRRRHDCG